MATDSLHPQTNEVPRETTMRQARTQYFVDNAFGDDGGYGSPWVHFRFFGLPLSFPNTGSRVRAVRYHDLHHILTGYQTDTMGEFEISAWELGAGCKNFYAAWVLNLSGAATGTLLSPRRIFRAFLRGLRSRTLYGEDIDLQLDRTVEEVRTERLGSGETPAASEATLGEIVRFGAVVTVGATLGTAALALLVATGPSLFVWSLVAPRFVQRVIASA
jgi:hypothetical protein